MPDRFGDDEQNLDPPAQLDRDELRVLAVRACALCDDDGYRGTLVCDHRVHAKPETRSAAMAAIRAALKANGGDA